MAVATVSVTPSVATTPGVPASNVVVSTFATEVGATPVCASVGILVGELPRGTVAVGMRVGCSVGELANGIWRFSNGRF